MNTSVRRAIVALAGAAALFVSSEDVRAGMYRCEMPGGGITFTDDKSKCPGAREHQPREVGHIQDGSLTPPPPSLAPSPSPAAANRHLDARAREGEKARWQQKKLQKQDEARYIDESLESVRSLVQHCNRGGYVVRRDASGIKQNISCNSIKAEQAELQAAKREIQEYLDDGIHDECRRAGCRPGWLR